MIMEFNYQIILFIIYILLLLIAIDYKNFGIRTPFLFNSSLNLTVAVSSLLSIYAFAIHPHIEKGLPPLFVPLSFSVILYFLMFFKRHKYGYFFVLAAFALSIYAVSSIYDIVDNENYSFNNDFGKIYKCLCGDYISKIIDVLERAKAEAAPDDPINRKKFNYMLFDESSEIYVYLNQKYAFVNRYKFNRKLAYKIPYSKFLGIYKLKKEKHNFYTTAGYFKDVIVYCDDVSESEVKAAVERARINFENSGVKGGQNTSSLKNIIK